MSVVGPHPIGADAHLTPHLSDIGPRLVRRWCGTTAADTSG